MIQLFAAAMMAAFPALQPGVTKPAPPTAAAPAKPTPESRVERTRLAEVLAALPTKRAARGDDEHLVGLYTTQDLLIKRLKDMGLEPALDEVDFMGSKHDKAKPLYNLIVNLPGSTPASPESPREVFIISAHFDAVPGAPGADDDGTGVAALLEIARVIKDAPMSRTVRLCFFNLEELGMVGSSKYAAELADRIRDKKEKIIGMVSLDMLGYYRTEEGTQKTFIPEATGFKSPKQGDFIAVVTTLRHRPACQSFVKEMRLASPEAKVVAVDFLPALADLLRSDHAPFLGMGIPSMLITDTAEYRNPHYHKPTDTIATIDMERFTGTVKALAGAVYRTAGPVDKVEGVDRK